MGQVAGQLAPIEAVGTSAAAFVDGFRDGPLDRATSVASFDEFERSFGGLDPDSEASYGVDLFFRNGGKKAWVVRVAGAGRSPPDAAALIGDPAAGTGLYALEKTDFNLLCVPGAASASGSATDLGAAQGGAVMEAAISLCERRRAFFLMDPHAGVVGAREISAWLEQNAASRHPNAALYYPRIRVPDPLDGLRPRTLGASGAIAGLFARIDASGGVWTAPAGREAVLRDVTELADALTDEEASVLARLGINPVRSLPPGRIVCWGARTLNGAEGSASEWKYVAVRRLALMLEESLERGTQWAVFEPNDEPLWARIRLAAGAFMESLFRQGAFQGTRPQDAYLVKCDAETTTQDDIERGVVNIVVAFAPLRPAEFVVLRIHRPAGRNGCRKAG